ncbi:hypothetical protein RZR10_15345 [Enterobacter asburiae]|uniref:hypothetical protein n=1 Tax=Enterobacter asburiae TaxID=61645 RepID=UPI00292B6A04|nr:hypothetical protein [Enterobacter asburiae]MDV1795100.1 hypothetical protein [Enterobacter asburiae]
MNNLLVAVFKTLLSTVGAVTILLSALLITLIFNMWIQDGVPPFENLKFSVAVFFTVIMLAVICQCLKYFMEMAIDRRDRTTR